VLHRLGQQLVGFYGPFRLLTSYLFLAGFGTATAAVLSWSMLPKLRHRLPTDRGRAFAVGAQQSEGKPVGGGIIFISIFLILCLLVVPLEWRFLATFACVFVAMLEGLLDDTSGGWNEYALGAIDLGISILGAVIVSGLDSMRLWLPLIKTPVLVSPWIFIPLASLLIWLTINATNCTDGVDGLSATLLSLAFVYLGGILYGVVGHQDIARYLLVPHYPDGANWAVMAFVMTGCLAGYLWHNSYPSIVLMGDAGSRPMGLLLGMLVLASGNPFLVFVVAGVVLANGGTGLLKVALLRFFNIGIFRHVRYPLHDHVRQEGAWSNTQVVVRFALLQALGTPLLLVLLLKVR
jgi:phospho-N-acetylmuramoyl-pentapeptide-transferase